MPRRQLVIQTISLGSVLSLAFGFLLLAYSAGSGVESVFFQWFGRRQIENSAGPGNIPIAPASAPPAGEVAPPRQPAKRILKKPGRGEPLATIEIKSVGLSVVVLEGSDDRTLKRGPGHIEDTAYPGEAGNIVIAAHRDTHFRPLQNIKKNDEIDVRTPTRTVRYYVDSTAIIEPTRMDILDPTPDPTLTLFTCYPFEYVGNAPQRFLIRALLAPNGAGQDTWNAGKNIKAKVAKEAGNARK